MIYDWGWNSDNTKKGHRILIDKREFPSGFTFTDLKKLQLFDLWDGDVSYHTDDQLITNTMFIPMNLLIFPILITHLTLEMYEVIMVQTEFSFEDNEIYKGHKVGFMNPSNSIEQWTHDQNLWMITLQLQM